MALIILTFFVTFSCVTLSLLLESSIKRKYTMKQLIILSIASLNLAACSTTNSNNLNSPQVDTDIPSQQICFYTNKPGWHFKQKHCVVRQAYAKNQASFMPINSQSQSNQPITVDKLPHSSQ
jgi:uncharacterized protein YcfL